MRVNDEVVVDEGELSYATSRSGGPGGQHANKTETRVTVSLDVASSPSFDDAQRRLLAERLGSRLSKDGVLAVSCESERSQRRNRELARERLAELLRDGLTVDKKRKPTRVPRSVHRRRIETKRRRGLVKSGRKRRWTSDD